MYIACLKRHIDDRFGIRPTFSPTITITIINRAYILEIGKSIIQITTVSSKLVPYSHSAELYIKYIREV